MLQAYKCWHYLCRETMRIVFAQSAFEARRDMARDLGVPTTDIIGRRA